MTLYVDDDFCCSDPINPSSDGVCDSDHLLKGSFTDVYQKALKEQLSESEPQIKNHIDHKLSMRQVCDCVCVVIVMITCRLL